MNRLSLALLIVLVAIAYSKNKMQEDSSKQAGGSVIITYSKDLLSLKKDQDKIIEKKDNAAKEDPKVALTNKNPALQRPEQKISTKIEENKNGSIIQDAKIIKNDQAKLDLANQKIEGKNQEKNKKKDQEQSKSHQNKAEEVQKKDKLKNQQKHSKNEKKDDKLPGKDVKSLKNPQNHTNFSKNPQKPKKRYENIFANHLHRCRKPIEQAINKCKNWLTKHRHGRHSKKNMVKNQSNNGASGSTKCQ